jgi:hypothetical protein
LALSAHSLDQPARRVGRTWLTEIGDSHLPIGLNAGFVRLGLNAGFVRLGLNAGFVRLGLNAGGYYL